MLPYLRAKISSPVFIERHILLWFRALSILHPMPYCIACQLRDYPPTLGASYLKGSVLYSCRNKLQVLKETCVFPRLTKPEPFIIIPPQPPYVVPDAKRCGFSP